MRFRSIGENDAFLEISHHLAARGALNRQVARLDELCADIARALTKTRGGRADNVELQLDLAPVQAPMDRMVPLAFVVGESIAHALDLLEGGPRAPLSVRLAVEDGWVSFAVTSTPDSKRATAASPAKRIIEGFAGQVGAEMAYDPVDPLSVRLRIRIAQPGGGPPET